jgi:hypothetical protein
MDSKREAYTRRNSLRLPGFDYSWPRIYDHIIRNREDFEETLTYIRLNPVRRGLVEHAKDWPYTERLDYLHFVRQAVTAWAGTSPAPTE